MQVALFRRQAEMTVQRTASHIQVTSIPTPRRNINALRLLFSSILLVAVTGCAEAPLDRAGTLASYDNLTPANGVQAHSLLRVSKDHVLAAKTVRVVPTVIAETGDSTGLSEKQRSLVANAVDRSLCSGLSDRFRIVPLTEPADLTVHAVITHLTPTNATAAGASKVASVAPSILLPGVPIPVPRIPIGLGSLSIEAEARNPNGIQEAAMIWGRGANSFTSAPRVSSDSDAYNLASSFGGDFSKLLVTGASPFGKLPPLPSVRKIGTSLGGAPKDAACEAFGRSPGIVGLIGNSIGVPPEWADKGGLQKTSSPALIGVPSSQ
jgi:hypothetical protein